MVWKGDIQSRHLYFQQVMTRGGRIFITFLNHPAEEFVDLLLAVAEVAALDVMIRLLAPATSGSVQLNEIK